MHQAESENSAINGKVLHKYTRDASFFQNISEQSRIISSVLNFEEK